MSERFAILGIYLVALICALTGIGTIVYGYIAIYSLSGFTSIFIGVAIILIAIGLIKQHAVARIGACIVLIISATGCFWWLFVYQQIEVSQVNLFGLVEYFCLIYIAVSIVAIIFLTLPSTRKYFS